MRWTTLVWAAGLFTLLLPGFGNGGQLNIGSADNPSCIDMNHNVICLHYFEQEKILLKKLLDGWCDDLQVRLIQPGSRLYAEVGEPLMLPAGFCQRKESVYLQLPRVKRIVAFEIQILAKKQDQSWGQVKSFPILVYPDDLLQPLKNWAKKKPSIGNG